MSDGSKDDWGYTDSDGSGSFYGGTGNNDSVYDEGDDDADDCSLGEAFGTIVGAGIAEVMAAGVKAAAEERKKLVYAIGELRY